VAHTACSWQRIEHACSFRKPEECVLDTVSGGVGHEESGLKFFKPLSDSHLAQHLAMLAIDVRQ
jgi:hypothetical protein